MNDADVPVPADGKCGRGAGRCVAVVAQVGHRGSGYRAGTRRLQEDAHFTANDRQVPKRYMFSDDSESLFVKSNSLMIVGFHSSNARSSSCIAKIKCVFHIKCVLYCMQDRIPKRARLFTEKHTNSQKETKSPSLSLCRSRSDEDECMWQDARAGEHDH